MKVLLELLFRHRCLPLPSGRFLLGDPDVVQHDAALSTTGLAVATTEPHLLQDFARPPFGYELRFRGLVLHLQAEGGGLGVMANRFRPVTKVLDLGEVGSFRQGAADAIEYGEGMGLGVDSGRHGILLVQWGAENLPPL